MASAAAGKLITDGTTPSYTSRRQAEVAGVVLRGTSSQRFFQYWKKEDVSIDTCIQPHRGLLYIQMLHVAFAKSCWAEID